MDAFDSAETNREDRQEVGGEQEKSPGYSGLHLEGPPVMDHYLDILLDKSGDFIAILNSDASIRYVSPSIQGLGGFAPQEVMGMNVFELVHPDDAQRLRQVFLEGIRIPGRVEHVECRLRKKNGGWSIVQATGSNLLDEPLVAGVLLNVRDVTELREKERELRDSEERYRYLVENLPPIVFTVDREGVLTYVSPAIERSTAFKMEDLIGCPFSDFVEQEDLAGVLASFAMALEGHVESYEFRIRDKSGKRRYIQTVSRPIVEGGVVTGLLGTMCEITERVEADEARRRNEEQFKAIIRRQIRYYHSGD